MDKSLTKSSAPGRGGPATHTNQDPLDSAGDRVQSAVGECASRLSRAAVPLTAVAFAAGLVGGLWASTRLAEAYLRRRRPSGRLARLRHWGRCKSSDVRDWLRAKAK